jgi:hypothetical protein
VISFFDYVFVKNFLRFPGPSVKMISANIVKQLIYINTL